MWGFIVDAILIVIILICVIVGIAKGFFDSLLSLIGTGLSLVASVFLAKYVANFINKIFNFEEFVLEKLDGATAEGGAVKFFSIELSNVEIAKFCVWICAVVVLFLAVKLVIFILSKIFEAVVTSSQTISGINRVLGMIFGLVKGCVTVIAILALCSLLAQVPVIGDPVYDAIQSSTVTSKVFDYVDEFCEKNLTEEKVDDLIDRIVSQNKENSETEETNPEEVAYYHNNQLVLKN